MPPGEFLTDLFYELQNETVFDSMDSGYLRCAVVPTGRHIGITGELAGSGGSKNALLASAVKTHEFDSARSSSVDRSFCRRRAGFQSGLVFTGGRGGGG